MRSFDVVRKTFDVVCSLQFAQADGILQDARRQLPLNPLFHGLRLEAPCSESR